jgi:hypothetical protein
MPTTLSRRKVSSPDRILKTSTICLLISRSRWCRSRTATSTLPTTSTSRSGASSPICGQGSCSTIRSSSCLAITARNSWIAGRWGHAADFNRYQTSTVAVLVGPGSESAPRHQRHHQPSRPAGNADAAARGTESAGGLLARVTTCSRPTFIVTMRLPQAGTVLPTSARKYKISFPVNASGSAVRDRPVRYWTRPRTIRPGSDDERFIERLTRSPRLPARSEIRRGAWSRILIIETTGAA